MTTPRYPTYGDVTTDWAVLGADTLLGREPLISPTRKWRYEDGLVLDGIHEIARVTGDPRYDAYVRDNVDAAVLPDGTIHGYTRDEWNLDHVNNGKSVLNVWEATGDERYRTAAATLLDQLLNQPRLDNGSFWHKQIYPRQMWLDGLYMGSVFYARCAQVFDRPDLFDDVVLQFTAAYDASLDPASGLCRHAFDETRSMYWADRDTGLSPHVWLRALGWFAMAMVDTLDHLPVDHPGRDRVHANLVSLLEAVQRHADPATNLWYQIPDQPGRPLNYLESSGSLMILTSIAKSLRTGLLTGARWEQALETGWANATSSFLSVTAEGWVNVHRMCEVAGLGGATRRDGTYAYYMSEPIVTNDHKGVGPFLLLAAEMRRRRP